MCFYVHLKNTKVKFARKNISVFKVVYFSKKNDKLCSNHRGFEYKLKENYSIKRKVKHFKSGFDFKEYHTDLFMFNGFLAHGKTKRSFPQKVIINSGFHSYDNVDRAVVESHTYATDIAVVKFTIPRGAKYYHNPKNQEYVSDKIKCVKILIK